VHDATLTGWHHVAVVYERKQPKLYLDGVLARMGLTSTRIVHPGQYLGESGAGYGYFQGLLRDVRIYSRAITAGEIEKLASDKDGRQ